MIDRMQLQETAARMGIPLSDTALERFDRYAALLVEWNQKMNLTAITQPEDIVTKHFIDSLLPLTCLPFPQGSRLIDVGSGAGFPAVPLLIARPDLQVTMADGLRKRVEFLTALLKELGLTAVCVHGRAELLGRDTALREQFDVSCARAVAPLPILAEYCLPFVRPGGAFLALKGPAGPQETIQSRKAIALLGGDAPVLHERVLPNGEARTLIFVKKISQTSADYPRPSAKIAKKPL